MQLDHRRGQAPGGVHRSLGRIPVEPGQVLGKGSDQGLAEFISLQHRWQQLALIELHHPHGFG